ncbi:4Fe-4S dicluster domain-containing protein [Dietzia cinnamea]|uniref:4Fe-4S dicluster domain-containing protein n=1 Tax=Dietzia cinnamea TaxID=321318 RepID=UPI0021A68E13|nr:4Fe-4S dicluster domain-containing protein [Dietzia cinnamea]MCT1884588.1 4Fe-4S dicluster domain-containing protein [Dietzia cinnamea]
MSAFLSDLGRSFFGDIDPAEDNGYTDPPPRKGFFTDTSVCIGCKACEVACKEWNLIPEDGIELSGMSYDNTQALGASTWRHVAFIEQEVPARVAAASVAPAPSAPVDLGMPAPTLPGEAPGAAEPTDFRWLMESDVCKHCTHAACVDVCPTGALMHTEFGTVVVQSDICNGCGYCVSACPYGVIERRSGPAGDPAVGIAQKCTLCYDRLTEGQTPACAKACPTDSIQFGDLDELRERAAGRLDQLVEAGEPNAQLYGHDSRNGVGGTGAFFLLLDDPEVYGLPPDPVVTTRHVGAMWRQAALAAVTLLGGAVAAFAAGGRS